MKIGISTAIVASIGTNIGIVATIAAALKVIGIVIYKSIGNNKLKSPTLKILK